MRLTFSDPGTYRGGKAVFLDRDGVINERIVGDYVRSWRDFVFSPDALSAIRILSSLHVPIIVVSNQAGVAKGLVRRKDLLDLTMEFQQRLVGAAGRIDGVYYCLHHPDEQCNCRKPRPGLLLQAASEWRLDLNECFMVGDADTDIIAGASVGCKTILVKNCSEPPPSERKLGCEIVKDLSSAVELLTKRLENAEAPRHEKRYSAFAFEA